MSTVTTKAIAKVAAVATGLAMATSVLSLAPMAHAASLTDSQVQSILSLLSSFGANSATIANVQAALTGQPSTSGSTSGSSASSSCSFTKDLTIGASGAEVTCLQKALIAGGYTIPAGATGYFGGQTKTAVVAWQKAAGVTPSSGYFGAISRAHWNLGGGSSTTGGSTGGSTGGVSAGTGNGLKVSLSPTSPNGSVLVQGQAIGDLADYTFANPTSAPINVTGMTLNRMGVSNDTTLTNIYLYSGGTRLTDSVGINNSQFSFTNAAGLFTVPAGSTYTVSIRSDIASSAQGQQIGVSLVSVSSTGTLDSSVSFPIMSGYQTVSSANLASVDYTNASATPAAGTVAAQNDYPVWQDSVSVSTNPVKLESMKFTNLGSISTSDLTNLRLYVDGVQVGSAVPTLDATRSVTFDFSSSPVTLSTASHSIKVLGNILNSGASRTIQLSVQRAADGMFVDSQLNQPVTPTAAGKGFSAISSGSVVVQSASAGVSVSKDPGSPNQPIAAAATNVKFASFDMLASGENVKVSDLYVYADTSVHNGGLDNGKVMVNGVQVGSTKDIVEGNGSSIAYGSATDFSLGSSLILPPGQNTVVDIYADAKTSTSTTLSNNETVKVYLAAGSSNAQGQSSLTSTNVPSGSNVPGNSVSISTSSLSATKYSGYGDQSAIAGASNTKLGAFTLSAGSTEGVTVNTIGITFANAVSSTITNLTVKDDATGQVVGSVITTPGSTGGTVNTFSGLSIDIPVSSTKTFDVYGNILSSANAGTIQAKVDYTTGGLGDVTNQSSNVGTSASDDVALQTITLQTSGTLTVTQGAGDPVSDNVLAGASSVHVGQFNFAAQYTPFTVQNLSVLVPNGAATSVTNVTLSYKDANGATQTVTQPLVVSSTASYATATFTGLTYYVPMNDSSNIDVYVGTPTIASGAVSGADIQVSLDDGNGTNTFRAVDSAGSSKSNFNGNNTNLASNGQHYVRKSIPTFAAIQTGLTAPASGSPLYKFSITADPAGAIEWTQLTFNISTSSATIAQSSLYLTDDATGNSLMTSGHYATTTSNTATINLLTDGSPTYQQVAAGATKTYDLYGSVSGFTTGSTVTISLATDGGSAPAANGTASAVGVAANKVAWSDRSTSGHSTSTGDWTNGYLLKNFTSSSQSYSK